MCMCMCVCSHTFGDAQKRNALILFSIFYLNDLEQPCVARMHFRFGFVFHFLFVFLSLHSIRWLLWRVHFSPFDVLPNLIFFYIFRIRPIHDGLRAIGDAVTASLVVVVVRMRSLRLIAIQIFARNRCRRPPLPLSSTQKSI